MLTDHMRLASLGYRQGRAYDERSHQGIGNEMISRVKAQGKGVVETRERLGGLLKYYHREAA